ncbi:Ypp1p LALA0_S06e00936g [Lachancea lanzarotensis]|uniref:Cargo-transport protein YPP1 n=1 Tax=Lachancea lanzarotensis TaxID=1245769 RepID=A0A0C7N7Y8_9SACH|nr:uncharacterized protein LALA0_S06e00936g [Lachancea lanzarotensis]CEP62668.1 LALA0S06e00936g1_1 [Lachancea lanzarotensis]
MTQELEDNSIALQDRLLGCGVFSCSDKELNALLSLHYRTHYHVFGSSTANKDVFKVLLGELNKVDHHSLSNLVKKRIWVNLQGILKYQLSDVKSAQRSLEEAQQVALVPGPFETFLQLETLYFIGVLKTEEETVHHYLQHIPKLLTELPREAHALTFHYLDLMVARLQMNWNEVLKHLKPSNVTYYIAVQADSADHEQQLLEIGTRLLKAAKFPTAEERNDFDLEQFHVVLQYYFLNRGSPKAEWRNFIVQSLGKTFQSLEVSRTAMIYFGLIKENKEAVLNFVNFMSYNENYKHLNDGRWLDIVSILESYRFIASQPGDLEIENVFSVDGFLRNFKTLLREFYDKISLPLIEREQSLDVASNATRIFLPSKLLRILAQSWNCLYEYEREDINSFFQSFHTYYLANATAVDSTSDTLNFNYAYTLAQKREIAQAIKFIKSAILEKEPENYRAWHLLALCESTNEDKTVSFRIVCSVLQALQQALQDGTTLSTAERWQMVHLKLTQLKITVDMFGVEDALELLPELFELLDSAFPPEMTDGCNLGPEFNKSKEYLQQTVWLFVVKLYMCWSPSDSREALAESRAQTTKFQNLNNDLAEGYMSLATDKKRSLELFEKVLFYDPMNIDATVGFAKCLIPDTDENEVHNMAVQKKDAPQNDAFIGDKDKSAAFARLKILLEAIIDKSIDGYHSPELWWYLAQVYENYGDRERMESSLWNCVKFEELRPIRDFKMCNI